MMMRLFRQSALAGLLVSFFCFAPAAFCSEPGSPTSKVTITSTDHKALAMNTPINTSTGFALKLFSSLPRNTDENLLVSPFSAYAALSMTLNGAAGKTKDEMAGVLGVNPAAIDELNSRNKSLFAALNANQKVQMEIANAIYVDRSTPFEKSFIELCQKTYGAEAHSENFSDEATVRAINAWCEARTHGKISKILEKLSPAEKMVLLNAIYFKGAWDHQFSKSFTVQDKFTAASGEKIPVKMMHLLHDQLYLRGQNFAAVVLPYAGRAQSMYIFLPDPQVDLTSFQRQFTQANWSRWLTAFRLADVELSLPRFKIDYSAKLNDVLSAMGMPDAFSEARADFSRMIKAPTWISCVLQKTYMDVNEEGTEAAAVTAVVMASRSIMMRPEPVVEFRVDRPFIVALVDEGSKEILFLGTIARP
jgi:serine protease inhibitor